jgi:hypothetical protein
VAVDLGFDESGNSDTLILGAQVGTIERARKMKTKWRAELGKAKVAHWHSIDYRKYGEGVFMHLSANDRKSLLAALSAHLRRRLSFGVIARITVSKYNAKMSNDIRSRWGSAYSAAIQFMLLWIRARLGFMQFR